MHLYQVIGRKAPTENDANPPAYRMKLFAPNEVLARSRFWYFMHQSRKMKKTTGEILDVNEVIYMINLIILAFVTFVLIDYWKEQWLRKEIWHLD